MKLRLYRTKKTWLQQLTKNRLSAINVQIQIEKISFLFAMSVMKTIATHFAMKELETMLYRKEDGHVINVDIEI